MKIEYYAIYRNGIVIDVVDSLLEANKYRQQEIDDETIKIYRRQSDYFDFNDNEIPPLKDSPTYSAIDLIKALCGIEMEMIESISDWEDNY